MSEQTKFDKAYSLNVNENTDKKNGLTYLSWAWAWAEFKKIYEDATFEVKMFDGKPYIYDENLGYMVFTQVTADNITHEMWLPVMDGANKAMKNEKYTYEVKDWEATRKQGKVVMKEKTVDIASMFDINKSLMRCFTKNLAMFGLGLYIYAGEDLPEVSEQVKSNYKSEIDAITDVDKLREYFKDNAGLGKEFTEYITKRSDELKMGYITEKKN